MKIVQRGNYDGDLIRTTVRNNGIENLDLYEVPNDNNNTSPEELSNIGYGINLYTQYLMEEQEFGILVDADMDGYSSASLVYQYSKDVNPNVDIKYFLHEKKAHGLTETILEQIVKSGIGLIIIPDASSNDSEQIKFLEDNDIKVLVLDHHHADEVSEHGVIINNQFDEGANKNLVGVGVVYKFLEYYDLLNGVGKISKYLDLFAAGQIGDSSDVSDPEIRHHMFIGLDNINNMFFKTVLSEEIGLVNEYAPKHFSFKLIPYINAVVRVGTMEERELIFKAMNDIDADKTYPMEKKKKNKTTNKFDKIVYDFNIYRYAYEYAKKCKTRQNSLVKKILKKMDDDIVDDCGIIMAFIPEGLKSEGVTGLVANKLVSKFDKPALVFNTTNDTFSGSGRGHEKTMSDFREWCENTGLVEYAQGHDNAFGISIHKDNLEAFKNKSQQLEKQEVVYECDIVLDKPNKDHAYLVEDNLRMFGGKVNQPLIGISNISVPKRFISQRGSMLKVFSYGVEMVKFGVSDELANEIMDYEGNEVVLDIVGEYGINDWGGQKKAQLIMKDIELASEENVQEPEDIDIDSLVF